MSDARARNSDPETSHEAAESISSEKIRLNQRAVFRFLKRFGPCTDTFLVERYARTNLPQQSPSGLRTRRDELVQKGLVEWTGDYVVLDTGRRARLWQIVGER